VARSVSTIAASSMSRLYALGSGVADSACCSGSDASVTVRRPAPRRGTNRSNAYQDGAEPGLMSTSGVPAPVPDTRASIGYGHESAFGAPPGSTSPSAASTAHASRRSRVEGRTRPAERSTTSAAVREEPRWAERPRGSIHRGERVSTMAGWERASRARSSP
jgi:hypothetical protein